jgi:hypothetical protein
MTRRSFLPVLAAAALAATPARAQVRNDSFRVFTVHSPPEIARVDTIYGQAQWWGGQPPDDGLTARLVLVRDSSGSDEGCSPLANAADIAGQLALIRRGTCGFDIKALHAQNAGAIAFLVHQDDRVPDTDCDPIIMSDIGITQIHIPGGFLPRCVVVPLLPTVHSGIEIMATLAPYFEDPNPASEEGPGSGDLSLTASPNPAGGRITLSLRLARAISVRVAVFDALGRRVAGVHSGLLAPGEHRFSLEIGRLTPGVYTVRAESERGQASRRLTIR